MLMMNRLNGARKGHRLLKTKADALQMRFRLILSKIVEVSPTDEFRLTERVNFGRNFSDENADGRNDERGSFLFRWS